MSRFLLAFLILFVSCDLKVKDDSSDLFVVVLGIAQDAGSPQIGCKKECCKDLWGNPQAYKKVVSLGIVDKKNNSVWMLDATPDFKDQLQDLLSYLPNGDITSLKGIFLTHAHIGHYTGLMDLGREAMGANKVPVYSMPVMTNYLKTNGPWSQLVSLNNIELKEQSADSTIILSKELDVTPFIVPHRDEFSETVGYKVKTADKSFIFIPDIDKWNKWDRSIKQEVENVDYAFLDGAFLSESELPNRDMSEIPHPFVPETIEIFENSDAATRQKVIFIHLNHTNPLLKDSEEYYRVKQQGFKVAREGEVFSMK